MQRPWGMAQRPTSMPIYRKDLDRFSRNVWSLFGLTKSLEPQGRLDDTLEGRSRFAKAWADADVYLTTASQF